MCIRDRYEIDRFNLPKHPSLKDIRHKEIFLDMAREMGWQVVAHDEDVYKRQIISYL